MRSSQLKQITKVSKETVTSVVEKLIEIAYSNENKRVPGFLRRQTGEKLMKLFFLSSSVIPLLPVKFYAKLISIPIDILSLLILVSYRTAYIAKTNNIDVEREKRRLASIVTERLLPYILRNGVALKNLLRKKSWFFSFRNFTDDISHRTRVIKELDRFILEAIETRKSELKLESDIKPTE